MDDHRMDQPVVSGREMMMFMVVGQVGLLLLIDAIFAIDSFFDHLEGKAMTIDDAYRHLTVLSICAIGFLVFTWWRFFRRNHG